MTTFTKCFGVSIGNVLFTTFHKPASAFLQSTGCSFLFNFCLLYLPDDGPSDSSKMFNCLKQIDSMLSSCVCSVNRSQMMSKYAKNISDIWFMMRYHFQLLSLLYNFPIYHPIGRWYAIIFRNKRMQ